MFLIVRPMLLLVFVCLLTLDPSRVGATNPSPAQVKYIVSLTKLFESTVGRFICKSDSLSLGDELLFSLWVVGCMLIIQAEEMCYSHDPQQIRCLRIDKSRNAHFSVHYLDNAQF